MNNSLLVPGVRSSTILTLFWIYRMYIEYRLQLSLKWKCKMDPSEIRFIVYNIEILNFKKIRILPKEVGGGRGTKIKGGVI